MKCIRVIHFIDSLRAGGKERQLVELLKGLSMYKEVVCELAIMSEDTQYNAVNNLDIKKHYLIRKYKKDPKIFVKLYKLCRDYSPDIIHCWGSMPAVYAVTVAKLVGIKLINGMIRDAPEKLKFFSKAHIRSKLTFPFSDVIVSNSFAGIKSYKAPLNKSAFIHNGFDFSRLENLHDKKSVKAKFRIDTDKVVGMVATFSNNKDYETFISAAQVILQKRDDVTFLSIGDGENLDKCKKLVKPQFQDRIRFLCKQNDVESIINIFDIGVLSTYTEGISNSIIEYMALGKPVVATDCGGTKELVLDGETGFLVKSHKANNMGERIEQLLEDKDLTINMGNAGRERIMREFNLEKMTNLYIAIYKGLLNV